MLTFLRALSSFGRAPRLQRGGDRFEPDRVHKRRGSSVVERSPEEAGVVSSILTRGTTLSVVAGTLSVPQTKYGVWLNWLEHLVWDQGIVGSSPTTPTIRQKCSFWRPPPSFGRGLLVYMKPNPYFQ